MDNRLAQYLVERGETERAFAEKLGVSPSTVSRWVRGARTPRPAMIRKILQVTGGCVTAAGFYGP